MVAIRGLSQSFSRLARGASLQIKFSKSRVFKMRSNSYQVSGQLNFKLSSRGSSSSLSESSSGSGGPQCADGPASRVVSWAVCFERLLEDHVGVRYFTEFLKSEVSAENILFYQDCEKFKKIPPTRLEELKKEARSIYDNFLSESSLHAVNIDDTAQMEESALETPTPDMFNKAQGQIFKLMKMDSYTRFVRSPLYQNCMLSCVEGCPLPNIGTPEPKSKMSKKSVTPPSNRKSVELKVPSSDSKTNRKKRLEKRGSWGADQSYQHVVVSRKESQISVKSNSSLELVSGFGRAEVSTSIQINYYDDMYCCKNHRASPLLKSLVELLSRAQCSRVEDQRGLLTKEQLELPQFLQLPAGKEEQTSCDQTQEEDCAL
uniref:Regulator of G-protein signaling 14-like n=1 Tax=Sinocyclocheilus rhinocerous TaxID=307959 RepID=A0A673JJE8_9TELE